MRAEALARRGEHDDAQRLAREAVALAEPTDALADKADALMALAAVLRAGGDEDGARERRDPGPRPLRGQGARGRPRARDCGGR